MCVCVCMFVCMRVCVCERERETERGERDREGGERERGRERERERETCVRISNCPTTCCSVLESCGGIEIGSRGVVWGGVSSLAASCPGTREEWGSEVWGCAGWGLWNSRGPMLVMGVGAVIVSLGGPVISTWMMNLLMRTKSENLRKNAIYCTVCLSVCRSINKEKAMNYKYAVVLCIY